MSDDHSNVDKKSGKKGSGSGSDFKPPHKKSKDFQAHYESKGNEKGPKDQSSVSKGNPPHQDDQHGSHGSNKPKSYTKNRKESANHPGGAAKRKHPKVSKDIILDFYAKAPAAQEVDELIASCAQLFVKEKQIPVNQEDNQLDPNEGLVPKNAYAPTTASVSTTSTTATSLTSLSGTTASTTTSSNAPTTSNVPANQNVSTTAAPTTTTTEPKPTTQAPVATPNTTTTTTAAPANTSGSLDPIQAMREKMKRDKAAKEQQKLAAAAQGEDANKRKESEQLELEKKKAEAAQKEQEERKLQSAPPQESAQDKEEANGEKYSDIDEMYEKRLKNKEGEEAKNIGTGEESNRALDEDNQRPEWENVDAGQVVREIGKDEFVSGLSQDKKTIFGDKYVEKDRLGNTASGVDFSKVSFDNETKNRMNDNFGIPSDMYGGRGGVQQGMPQEYYNPQDAGQSNMYKGAQGQSMQQQQGGSLYANKSYNANQAAPVTPTSSAKQTAQAAYPSVIFKYFSPNYDAKVWSYIDLEDHLQGPFSGRTMDEWYSKGYLPLELSVTIGKNSGFRGLKELAEIIINHNTQESVQQPEKPIQKIPSSTALPEQQYQQQQYQQQQQYYQQQQQQQQYQPQSQTQHQQQQYYQQQHHQQQQQQYQPQQQYSQQQQQQQYYRQQQQQQNPQANEMQRFHSDTSSYGTNFQTTANRVKNFEGSEVSNMYYGQQQQQQGGQGQFGSQHDYHRSASATNIQNQGQNYYQNYDNYYQEPQQQKQQQGYQAYTKAGSNTNLPSSSYYQESNMYQGGFNQPGYNQPQKTATQQWKGPQQGAGAGYSGGMTPTGGGYGGQNASFGGQAGYSGMYGGMQGGQGQGQGQANMTYAMQQQMLNRGSGNPNMGGDMKGMQGMLGMQRPASRQQQQEEPDY